MLLPGLMVAATGVGAGDLVTGALAGSETGTALLWAAALGALLKCGLNEGLARWQLATDTTLLEGWVRHLGRPLAWAFGVYLVLWSFVVGGALVNACAVAGAAWFPLGDPGTSRLVWGSVHSLLGLLLARLGGFRVFERLMAAAVVVMTVCVIVSAVRLAPGAGELASGFVPSLPEGGTAWTLGVLGGVGGTVTLLSYGYWIREHGRRDLSDLPACRIDLAAAYALTALFGMAMIVIGSRIVVHGQGAGVALALGDADGAALGPAGRTIFLAGFHAAVFSSLLGVWQGVPYLFADLLRLTRRDTRPLGDPSRGRPFRLFQLGLALAPLPLLGISFRSVSLAYAVGGALFMPFLALTLLMLTNRVSWIGARARSGWLSNGLLLLTLALFAWQGVDAWLAD